MPNAPEPHSVIEIYLGGNYTDEEFEFLKAIDRYKRDRRRQFPTWTEVLRVLKSLGYRKLDPPGPLPDFQPEGAPCPSSAESPPP